jgi:hypothetical protein
MLAQLSEFYKSKGISALEFKCPYFNSCSQFAPKTFTTAKEAFVSSGYVEHEYPRILFLSLDSGSASNDPKLKTLEAVRKQEECEQRVLFLPKNKHWYRTHELAFTLLRNFIPNLHIENVKKFFSHTNSAKCCMNNVGREQAKSILFDNCRNFIPHEIEILNPDVFVSQGNYAKLAVENKFADLNIRSVFSQEIVIPEEVNLIQINNHPVIWIHTIHPRNPNSKKNRDNYKYYEEIVSQIWGPAFLIPIRSDLSSKYIQDWIRNYRENKGSAINFTN